MTYTFPYDRLKLLVFTIGSVALTILAGGAFIMLFIGQGEAAEVLRETTGMAAGAGTTMAALTAFGLASGLCLTAARFFVFMRSGPVLTIDELGILDRRVGRRVAWQDVRTVELRGRSLLTAFAITLHEDGRHRGGRKGAEVRVNVGALRCQPMMSPLAH